MSSVIISDNQTTATKLRHALIQCGYDCPISSVISLAGAAQFVKSNEFSAKLITFVLAEDTHRSLAILEELRKATATKIIAVGSTQNPRNILAAVHAGAEDYLDEAEDVHAQILASVERIQASHTDPRHSGRIIAVTSVSGGSGASLIACNLAVELAKRNGTCGLFDFDVRKGDQASLFNIEPRHTIADLCANLSNLDENMLEQSLVKHGSGVRLLSAPQRMSEIGDVTVAGLRKIVSVSRLVLPTIVIDCDDCCDSERIGTIEVPDAVMLVFRLDFPSVRNLRRALEYWDASDVPPNRIVLVANRRGQRQELPVAQVEKAIQRRIEHFIPDEPNLANLSFNCGMPVTLEVPNSRLSRALSELTKKMDPQGMPQSVAAENEQPFLETFMGKLSLFRKTRPRPELVRAMS